MKKEELNEMSRTAAARWIYSGIWMVLVRWFRVPVGPPHLPPGNDGYLQSFKPSPHFLTYLKLFFWLGMGTISIMIIGLWLIILGAAPPIGLILLPVFLLVVVVPNLLTYIAIHLRYDTTWYVLSSRSMCLRRGIMDIHEITITYENIQNINVSQGPIQRLLGISNLVVETTGGSGNSDQGEHHRHNPKRGLIEGIENAKELQTLIQRQLLLTNSAGLGDEDYHESASPGWTAEHLGVLRDIRDAVTRLAL